VRAIRTLILCINSIFILRFYFYKVYSNTTARSPPVKVNDGGPTEIFCDAEVIVIGGLGSATPAVPNLADASTITFA
jgi:hypothetical protein